MLIKIHPNNLQVARHTHSHRHISHKASNVQCTQRIQYILRRTVEWLGGGNSACFKMNIENVSRRLICGTKTSTIIGQVEAFFSLHCIACRFAWKFRRFDSSHSQFWIRVQQDRTHQKRFAIFEGSKDPLVLTPQTQNMFNEVFFH